MEIKEYYTAFVRDANRIPGFVVGQKEDVPYDITELANMYVLAEEEGDESAKSAYFSALMVRYWHMTSLLYEKSNTLPIEKEDAVRWLEEAILIAMGYKSWLNPDKAVSKDRKGAEKCINQCITSRRQFWFKHYNQQKRKDDKYLQSLDDAAYSDSEEGRKVTVLDTVSCEDDNVNPCAELIDKALQKGDVLSGFIIDGIAYQDMQVDRKLMKHLKSLTPGFIEYFASIYCVDKKAVEKEASRLRSINATDFDTKMRKSLGWIRRTAKLCM